MNGFEYVTLDNSVPWKLENYAYMQRIQSNCHELPCACSEALTILTHDQALRIFMHVHILQLHREQGLAQCTVKYKSLN